MEKMNEMDDEINLIDIIKVLVKRKVLIVGVVLLFLIIAVVVSLRLPKVYKINFVVDIGMIQRGQKKFPIEETAELRTNSPYYVSKAASDNYLQYMKLGYDFPVTVIRPLM